MYATKPICAVLLAWVVVFGLNRPVHAISNGELVSESDPVVPVTVSVYSANDDCTGVKIASSLILTARHCELDQTTKVIFSNNHSYSLARYFIPRTVVKGNENDFDAAIIEIDGVVPGPVAKLVDKSTPIKETSAVWIAGYGGNRITSSSNPLRKLKVKISDWDYSSFAVSVRTRDGGGVCDGDSGGPGYRIVNNQVVVWGIDSASVSGNSQCASQELYSKLNSKRDWIGKIIAAFGLKHTVGQDHQYVAIAATLVAPVHGTRRRA